MNTQTTRKHRGKMFNGRRYINAKKAAEIIGVSQTTFSAWHKKGVYVPQIEQHTFDSRTLYQTNSVREFAKEYKPHARVAVENAPQKAVKPRRKLKVTPKHTMQANDADTTLGLVLDVLVQLEKTISEIKEKQK